MSSGTNRRNAIASGTPTSQGFREWLLSHADRRPRDPGRFIARLAREAARLEGWTTPEELAQVMEVHESDLGHASPRIRARIADALTLYRALTGTPGEAPPTERTDRTPDRPNTRLNIHQPTKPADRLTTRPNPAPATTGVDARGVDDLPVMAPVDSAEGHDRGRREQRAP